MILEWHGKRQLRLISDMTESIEYIIWMTENHFNSVFKVELNFDKIKLLMKFSEVIYILEP